MTGYRKRDSRYWEAKDKGFAARSIFKLEDIDQRFKLIREGQTILDLGCSPGSWSQYISSKLRGKGRLIGVDLVPMNVKVPSLEFIQGDFNKIDWEKTLGGIAKLDAVVSDMAPNTSGDRLRDQTASLDLCDGARALAARWLKPGGFLIMKMFEGPDSTDFVKRVEQEFEKVQRVRPPAVRKASKEFYILATGFRGGQS